MANLRGRRATQRGNEKIAPGFKNNSLRAIATAGAVLALATGTVVVTHHEGTTQSQNPDIANTATTTIPSTGTWMGEYTVNGQIYVDASGVQNFYNPPWDTCMNGVTINAYWIDNDGSVSPTYTTTSQNTNGEDGLYSILMQPWTDANGVVHTFDAIPGEQLKVWAVAPDGYYIAHTESNPIGTSTVRDNAAWNLADGSHNVYNWTIALQEKPQDWLSLNPPTTTGMPAASGGFVEGTVFWDNNHAWGATQYPLFNPLLGDIGAANVQFKGLYGDSYKSQGIYRPDQNGGAQWGDPVANATDGSWLQGNWWTKHINGDYMYVYPVVGNNANVTMSSFQQAIFQPVTDTTIGQGLNNAQSGFTNVLFPLYPAQPAFDVTPYDSISNPAQPGDTATVNATGLEPNTTYKIKWVGSDGTTTTQSITTDSLGAYNGDPLTVPSTINGATTYTAYLIDPSGQTTQADSFIALNNSATLPWGSVGDAYNGTYTQTIPAGATQTYSATGLPAGLSIDPSTGAITGTPTAAGTYSVTFTSTVTYADGTTGTFTVTYPDGSKDVAPVSVTVTAPAGNSGTGTTGNTGTGTGSADGSSASDVLPIVGGVAVVGGLIDALTHMPHGAPAGSSAPAGAPASAPAAGNGNASTGATGNSAGTGASAGNSGAASTGATGHSAGTGTTAAASTGTGSTGAHASATHTGASTSAKTNAATSIAGGAVRGHSTSVASSNGRSGNLAMTGVDGLALSLGGAAIAFAMGGALLFLRRRREQKES